MNFIDSIKLRAKKDKKRIVLPESMDKRTMEAADKALKEDIADIMALKGSVIQLLRYYENIGFLRRCKQFLEIASIRNNL